MGVSAAIAVVAAAAAYQGYQTNQQNKDMKGAQGRAEQQAAKQADLADQAQNKANAKRPNVGAMLEANQAAATGGQSGTMLTGSQGVDPATLNLGKNTLLGL